MELRATVMQLQESLNVMTTKLNNRIQFQNKEDREMALTVMNLKRSVTHLEMSRPPSCANCQCQQTTVTSLEKEVRYLRKINVGLFKHKEYLEEWVSTQMLLRMHALVGPQ